MKAYSLDLRQRVLQAALSGGHTIEEVARPLGVGTAFVNKMLRLHRAGADLASRHEKLLRSQVRQQKDATLEELRTHPEGKAGPSVSISTVSRALIRHDLGRKKKSGGERAE